MNIFSALFSVISVPLGWLMRFIYNAVGNYGLALILFTIVTKIILLPLAIKQKKSMIRMNAFQPEIQAIQKRYANEPAKQQEELARLQQEHNFSMTSGCLPVLIQMPILFGLIDVIYKPLRHIAGVSASVISEITPIAEGIVGTLSRYSPQTDIINAIKLNPSAFAEFLDASKIEYIQKINMTFLGLDLSATPSLKVMNALLLIPVLSVASMIISQILTQKLSGTKMEGSMKFMPIWSAVMFGYFSFIMPAGVSIYWIFSSVFTIIQELVLSRFFDPEKEKRKIQEEIAAARKARREEQKRAKPKQKRAAARGDKYVEDTYASAEEKEAIERRLARARALDKEKYGD